LHASVAFSYAHLSIIPEQIQSCTDASKVECSKPEAS